MSLGAHIWPERPREPAPPGEAPAPPAAPEQPGEPARGRPLEPPRRRGPFSPLTRRILALNVVALAILVGGVLYLDQYRQGLIRAEIEGLETQGKIFAAALGEGAVAIAPPPSTEPLLLPSLARQMMRRLVAPTRVRARLYDADRVLVADSWVFGSPGGMVEVEELPPPGFGGTLGALAREAYDLVTGWFPGPWEGLPGDPAAVDHRAAEYDEVAVALGGEVGRAIRTVGERGMTLSVAVPVQHYKQVVGALLLSTSDAEIEAALRSVRLNILKVFLVALAVTVLLSLYLAGTIARPIRRLAAAADQVSHGHGRKVAIPDFVARKDEIGDLSGSLRDMTAVLWERMDAIEGFAADVAHEIKNPLTSLRSAVETASRVTDPDRQRQLMAIILEDVERLDRLISDISDASRLDAELSRTELAPVDIGGLLATLVDIHDNTRGEDAPRLVLDLPKDVDLHVQGMEGRLVQVFRNLIANAVSFSRPGGVITCRAERQGGFVTITVEDEGPGIPDGKLEAIFERFYTERPRDEKFGTHSGLGLSISRQIVAAHDGTITAENRRDEAGVVRGARFIVRLPAL